MGHQSLAASQAVYTIEALIAEGFTKRTIHYYVNIGVLPRAYGGRGSNAYYTEAHLSILRSIKRTRDQNKRLDDVRDETQRRFAHAFRRA